jgi:YHS domain-containing protein
MRMIAMTVLASSFAILAADTKTDTAKAKKGLQDIGEFVGQWNLTADSKATGKLVSWKETVMVAWKFKGDDAWLAVDIKKDGKDKESKTGELRYAPDKKLYTLSLTDAAKKVTTYSGEFKKGKLILESKDEKTKAVEKLTLNTLADGIRMSMVVESSKDGGLFDTLYKATGNKDGESIAGTGAKKPECIVTGGTATITVSYNGKTYYVCCTGCRDEFNENPKKYVDALEKAKK